MWIVRLALRRPSGVCGDGHTYPLNSLSCSRLHQSKRTYGRELLKEMINRGGEKIAPSDIEAALLSNLKVLEAVSFGESDPMYGESVQAAVILRPGTKAGEDELRDYSRTRLGAFEVPERIHILAAFPRTAKGSPDRHTLAAQFAGPESSSSSGGRKRAPR